MEQLGVAREISERRDIDGAARPFTTEAPLAACAGQNLIWEKTL
jgi:hypothetical protein